MGADHPVRDVLRFNSAGAGSPHRALGRLLVGQRAADEIDVPPPSFGNQSSFEPPAFPCEQGMHLRREGAAKGRLGMATLHDGAVCW